VDGLMTVCHDARKGRYDGSHWPNHVRASALLDQHSVSAEKERVSLRMAEKTIQDTLSVTSTTLPALRGSVLTASKPGSWRPVALKSPCASFVWAYGSAQMLRKAVEELQTSYDGLVMRTMRRRLVLAITAGPVG
jgi:hypothetical protein